MCPSLHLHLVSRSSPFPDANSGKHWSLTGLRHTQALQLQRWFDKITEPITCPPSPLLSFALFFPLATRAAYEMGAKYVNEYQPPPPPTSPDDLHESTPWDSYDINWAGNKTVPVLRTKHVELRVAIVSCAALLRQC